MKTYDVTIRLTVVDLSHKSSPCSTPSEVAARFSEATEEMVQTIARGPSKAVEVRGVEVVDHDSIPQPTPICSVCRSNHTPRQF